MGGSCPCSTQGSSTRLIMGRQESPDPPLHAFKMPGSLQNKERVRGTIGHSDQQLHNAPVDDNNASPLLFRGGLWTCCRQEASMCSRGRELSNNAAPSSNHLSITRCVANRESVHRLGRGDTRYQARAEQIINVRISNPPPPLSP